MKTQSDAREREREIKRLTMEYSGCRDPQQRLRLVEMIQTLAGQRKKTNDNRRRSERGESAA